MPVPISSTGNTDNSKRLNETNGIRRGKWTDEEVKYADKIIECFNNGTLNLPENVGGITLRTYLAEKLGCEPMRITKKYTGASCLGKRAYHGPISDKITKDSLQRAESDLKDLESKFKNRLELSVREKREREANVDEMLMRTHNQMMAAGAFFGNPMMMPPAIAAGAAGHWGFPAAAAATACSGGGAYDEAMRVAAIRARLQAEMAQREMLYRVAAYQAAQAQAHARSSSSYSTSSDAAAVASAANTPGYGTNGISGAGATSNSNSNNSNLNRFPFEFSQMQAGGLGGFVVGGYDQMVNPALFSAANHQQQRQDWVYQQQQPHSYSEISSAEASTAVGFVCSKGAKKRVVTYYDGSDPLQPHIGSSPSQLFLLGGGNSSSSTSPHYIATQPPPIVASTAATGGNKPGKPVKKQTQQQQLQSSAPNKANPNLNLANQLVNNNTNNNNNSAAKSAGAPPAAKKQKRTTPRLTNPTPSPVFYSNPMMFVLPPTHAPTHGSMYGHTYGQMYLPSSSTSSCGLLPFPANNAAADSADSSAPPLSVRSSSSQSGSADGATDSQSTSSSPSVEDEDAVTSLLGFAKQCSDSSEAKDLYEFVSGTGTVGNNSGTMANKLVKSSPPKKRPLSQILPHHTATTSASTVDIDTASIIINNYSSAVATDRDVSCGVIGTSSGARAVADSQMLMAI